MVAYHRVSVEPVGREVRCREDQPILDACLRAGIWVPHSCTHGTCGTCKAELIDGEVDHGNASAFALMDFERDEGKVLLCQASPRSDLVVEADVDVDEGLELHPVRDFTGTVTELADVARDIRVVRIALDEELRFAPGQYVALRVPGTPATRTYSLANPPTQRRLLELHVRRTPGGLASDGWVFGPMAAGERVSLSGPYGRFVFRPARPEPAIMVAGGTGLAPIASMIRHALAAPSGPRLYLYHGARTRADLYCVDEFRALAAAHPDRFRYRPCLSEQTPEDPAGGGWDGGAGLVTDVLAADFDRCSGHVGYVCGPPPMVDAALKLLMRKRLFPRDIYREDFFSEADRATGGVRSPLLRR
ncbi:NADH:ubiquinone reductase (Na(+)-transporting) subunit F [Phytohabitans suffuscus]|uniref:Phenol hydroxylase P5 protein n=1 Tax=Phytohabitans suffuscus TaxID=624315 RepID=A0A6F8YTL2_9ACTN|nr:2Fe-2S iron-sulfur cluster binding domain-containing protein [Phytohabitans suffuscus]BCB89515.1 phenol hydroxylase P5 protein [Phytohabitans suffuscus]